MAALAHSLLGTTAARVPDDRGRLTLAAVLKKPGLGGGGGGGGGAVTPAQDWTNRSTLSGVELAVVWEDATTYFGNPTYVHPGSTNVSWFPDDGILGKGCLNFMMGAGAGAGNSDAWHAPHGDSGTDLICIQFRVKFGPNRFVDRSGTGGMKVMIHGGYNAGNPASSRSHVNNEEVLQFYGSRHNIGDNSLASYRDLSQGGLGGAAEWFAGTSNSYQNAVDNGAGISDPLERFCRYDPTKPDQLSNGCVQFEEGKWYTIQIERRILTPGGTAGNIWRVRYAGEFDSAWTTLIDLVDPLMPLNSNDPLDFTSNGPGAVWFLGFMTASGAVASGWDSFQRYDQLIVRRGDVLPCPVPRTLPTYTNQTLNAWVSLGLGTRLSLIDPVPTPAGNQGPGAKTNQWGSYVIDLARSEAWILGGGGHAAYSGNEVGRIRLEVDAPFWEQILGPTPAGSVIDANPYADGRPTSSHLYYSQHWQNRFGTGRGVRIGGARYPTGDTISRVDVFNRNTGDWTLFASYPSIPSQVSNTGALQQLALCRDPRNDNIYAFGNNYVFMLDAALTAWTQKLTGSGANPYGERMATAFDTKRQNILCVGGDNTTYPGHHVYDPDANTMTTITFTGSGAASLGVNVSGAGLHYIEALDCFLLCKGTAGAPIWKITYVNATTYDVTVFAITGASPAAHLRNEAHNQFFYAPRLKGLFYQSDWDQPMHYMRIEA